MEKISIMDEQEKIVYEYLKSIGHEEQDIVFEPDGNITPDFLLQGDIAIEVRRLNQNTDSNGRTRGLEEDAIPLYKSVSKTLESFNGRFSDRTYFVFIRYSRPTPKTKAVKRLTKEVLETFCRNPSDSRIEIPTEENITYVIFPASYREGISFLMAGDSDSDRGGWLLDEMEKNIRHCATEKQDKISSHKHKYPTWWLALVDHIGFGLDAFDRELFVDQVNIEHNWDKILIVSPNKSVPAIEI